MITKKPYFMTFVIGAALLSACVTSGGQHGGRGSASATEAPVAAQAAVLETLFARNASGSGSSAPTYCVRAGGVEGRTDVTRNVVAVLRDNPKVKPASACEIAAGGNGVFDRQTRQRALTFSVVSQSCSSSAECLIRGGYYEGNLSAQTNLYRARRVDGGWVVMLEEMGPVS